MIPVLKEIGEHGLTPERLERASYLTDRDLYAADWSEPYYDEPYRFEARGARAVLDVRRAESIKRLINEVPERANWNEQQWQEFFQRGGQPR
jgi:hypothetical protein